MMIADSVINHWKDNIVYLDLFIHGFEFFLTDPDLRMLNLQGLKLRKHKYEEFNEESVIVSALINKHTDILKSLDIQSFADVDIPDKLRLTSFTAHNLHLETVQSVLAASSQTLLQFQWRMDFKSPMIEGFVCPPLPQLKELTLFQLPIDVLLSILKSCCTNLETLRLFLIYDYKTFDVKYGKCRYYKIKDNALKGIQLLQLKKFEIQNSDFHLAKEIMKSCKSSLEELGIEETYMDPENKEILTDLPRLPNLAKFSCKSEDAKVAFHIINLAENLSEVALFEMDAILLRDTEVRNKFTKIKRLKCRYVSMTIVYPIIESAQQSLQVLDLFGMSTKDLIMDDSILQRIPFLNLKVKKFMCGKMPKRFSTKLLEAMETSVEELHIKNNDDLTIEEDIELNLKVLKVESIKAETFLDILESTQPTLERLSLANIVLDVKGFRLPKFTFPKLHELEIGDVPKVFLKPFLKTHQFNLKTLKCATTNADIINYKNRNPDCCVVVDNSVGPRKSELERLILASRVQFHNSSYQSREIDEQSLADFYIMYDEG